MLNTLITALGRLVRMWVRRVTGRDQSAKTRNETTGSPVAWSSLAAFLEDLEQIGRDHEELYDTDVRERMWNAVEAVLIKQTTAVSVPSDLGMFTAEGNARLKEALEVNVQRLREVFDVFALKTEEQRRTSFFNPHLHTEQGRSVDDFFGHP